MLSIHLLEHDQTIPQLIYVNPSDLLSYKIENVLTRITSVLDRALHAVNQIYELHLSARDCRYRTVIINTEVSVDTIDALQKLKVEVDKFREDRNMIAHEETYSDKFLSAINAHEVLGDKIECNDVADLVSSLQNDYLENKISEYKHFYNMAILWIDNLLNSLASVAKTKLHT